LGGEDSQRETWKFEQHLTSLNLPFKTPALYRNMSNNHRNCPLCKEKVSWPGYYKHFYSVKHVEQFVKPAILKEKGSHALWRKGTKKSALPMLFIDDKAIYCCFGCKKAQEFMPSTHLSECPHAEAHLSTLKGMLEGVEEAPEASAEVDALKKQIERLKKDLAMAEETIEKCVTFEDEVGDFHKRVLGMGYYDFTDKYKDSLEDGSLISYEDMVVKLS
jgi:hypothetical protein